MKLLLSLLFVLLLGGLTGCGESAAPLAAPPAPTERVPAAEPVVSPAPATPTPPPPVLVTPPPTPTALPVASPTLVPAPSPTPLPREQTIGRSTSGAPLVAQQVGVGPLKIVVAGDNQPLVGALLAYFSAEPSRVPSTISLWFIPNANPDGVALLTNADTNNDGCAGNEWSRQPDRSPFALPEARALRDFSADAHIVLLYTADDALSAIVRDRCRTPRSAALAQTLQDALRYPVPSNRDVTGHFVDYLAGEGIAAAAVAVTDAELGAHVAALDALLAQATAIASADARSLGATATVWGADDVGTWRYAPNTFVHPLALAVVGDTAYMVDSGRVLALNLAEPQPPQVLLRPGDIVGTVPVQEPLDLTTDGAALFVLDRVGDTYRFELASAEWTLDRYDRPVRDISAHYYVGVAADAAQRYLLETSYQFVLGYAAEDVQLWSLPEEAVGVDISTAAQGVYVLSEETVRLYRDTALVEGFRPNLPPREPRQLVATDAFVYVLDNGGRRVLAYAADSGLLRHVYAFADRRAIAAIWSDGERLLLAGRDALLFVDEPQRQADITGGEQLSGPQPHDAAQLQGVLEMIRPIQGTEFATREFQLPGAPRHYRLGIHEGFDFYWQRGTTVLAAADGTVIRATTDYVDAGPTQFDYWRGVSLDLGYTSAEAHDFYRGRQVWIEHADGIVTRYVHLSAIEPGITVGTRVTQGQPIGLVGNSGSPGSLEGETVDAHLHFELWIGDGYLGQFLRPIETRAWGQYLLP